MDVEPAAASVPQARTSLSMARRFMRRGLLRLFVATLIAAVYRAFSEVSTEAAQQLHGSAWANSLFLSIGLWLARPIAILLVAVVGLFGGINILRAVRLHRLRNHRVGAWLSIGLAVLVVAVTALSSLAIYSPLRSALARTAGTPGHQPQHLESSTVDAALMYCHGYAQQHGGQYPADLSGLAGWARNAGLSSQYQWAELRYLGAGVPDGASFASVVRPGRELFPVIVLICQDAGASSPVALGFWDGQGRSHSLYIDRQDLTKYLTEGNRTRRDFGLPPISP